MKRLTVFLATLLAVTGLFAQEVTFSVQNRLKRARTNEIVELNCNDIYAKMSVEKGTKLAAFAADGNELVSQITYNNRLLVLIPSINAQATTTIKVKATAPAQFTPMAYGRLIPERKDDYAFENNKVAFRVYGMVLKATDGPSNGVDVWMKRVPEMIINDWYKLSSQGKDYHVDRGQGLDCYKVGRTLGGGMPAPYYEGKLVLGENFVSTTTLDNGPLRTTVRIKHNPLLVGGEQWNETRVISLDAHSNFARMNVTFGKKGQFEEKEFAAGITLHEGAGSRTMNEELRFVSYWEDMGVTKDENKKENPNGQLGTAVIMTKKAFVKNVEQEGHLLSIGKCQGGKSATYYFGAGWSKFGFANEKEWTNAVKAKAESINSILKATMAE